MLFSIEVFLLFLVLQGKHWAAGRAPVKQLLHKHLVLVVFGESLKFPDTWTALLLIQC